ncbi:MAG TPA: hypothetical protein VLG40_05125 [Candidatus Saccharimonas sp.]|nr:hypothetical protein [Candidatus Saccharimonas sp.]
MNDIRFETQLVAATNHRSNNIDNFVKNTMQKIRAKQPKQNFWRWLHARPFGQQLAFGVLAAVVVSVVSFTSYAYAIGSNPVDLVKRWIEGDKIKVEYQGRTFEYGKSRNYSDAAVTALAEVNTVQGLHARAVSNLLVPKNGVEYVTPPAAQSANGVEYVYPFFATVTSVDATTVTLHKQYVWGDKMNPSHDLDETITVPLATFRPFIKGEPAQATASVGQLAMIYTDDFVRHVIGTPQVNQETEYFSFVLTHQLDDIKQVAAKGQLVDGKDGAIFEPNWGGGSDICGNNGADTCGSNPISQSNSQGLFVSKIGPSQYNPDAIQYGEEVPVNGSQPKDIIVRFVTGTITAIDDTQITVKTSSGALWHFVYTAAERAAFAKRFSPLKVGDQLGGMALESIYNLDNRTIDNAHIMSLAR